MISKKALVSRFAFEPVLSLLRDRRSRHRALCLMYHEVLPDGVAPGNWSVVKESDFVRQMEYVKKNFRPMDIAEAISVQKSQGRWPSRAMVVTFDDGYRGNLNTVLPVIESLEIPITIYLATNWIETGSLHWYDTVFAAVVDNQFEMLDLRYAGFRIVDLGPVEDSDAWWTKFVAILDWMKSLSDSDRQRILSESFRFSASGPAWSAGMAPLSVDDAKRLSRSRWVTLGAHSHGHELLTYQPDAAVETTIRESRVRVEDWAGSQVKHFAYPNGCYNDSVKRIVRDSGFDSAVTTKSGYWCSDSDPMALPRIAVGRFDPPGFFRLRLAGIGT